MKKKPAFPAITFTCPSCQHEHKTLLLGVESAIYIPCECGKVIGYYLTSDLKG